MVRYPLLRWLVQLWLIVIFASFVHSQTCPKNVTLFPTTTTIPQIGELVQLYCSYPGSVGDITWTKDNGLSIQSDVSRNPCNCIFSYIAQNNTSLFINVSSNSDYGTYKCTALVSFVETCFSDIVIQSPVPAVLSIMGSTSQTANQGSTVTFSINLTNPGLPVASVVWTKDGVSLSNSTKILVTSTMLQISNVQAGDRGQYIVMATNKAGSINATFNLFVNFITATITRDNTAGLITCTAQSYPDIITLIVKENNIAFQNSMINSKMLNNFTYQAYTTVQGSTDYCNQQYSCDGQNSLRLLNTSNLDRCMGSNIMFTFKPVGYNGIFIQWSPVVPIVTSYPVKYRVVNTNSYFTAPSVSCGTVCNTTIAGLTPGVAYGFTVGVFPEQQMVVTQGLPPVTGVVAIPTSSDIVISWNAVPRATGYLVLVSQGANSSFIQNVTMATNTTVIPGLVCGVLYTFRLQAYNALNFSSPSPTDGIQATNYCSKFPAILSVSVDGTMVKVTLINVDVVTSVKVTATSDSGVVYYYNPTSLGGLCLGGLPQDSIFTICASFYLVTGGPIDDCYAQKIQTKSGSSNQLCDSLVMSPSGTVVSPTSGTSGIQPWVIGVLVVGLLGLIATVFCVMGMYLACRADKTDQVNFGSSLSLDISPNGTSQSHNPSFKADKSVSPPRSCLSRSTRSHTITWKDQMDTIRQLESNGTSV